MDYSTTTSATTSSAASGGASAVTLLFYLVVLVVMLVAMWKIFTKAGQAGWKSLIPIYNLVVLMKIVGRPAWWVVLLFVPLVNIVISVMLSLDLAKAFGRSPVFGVVALFLFSPVGYAILAFSGNKYVGPAAVAQPASAAAPAPAPTNPTPPPATPGA